MISRNAKVVVDDLKGLTGMGEDEKPQSQLRDLEAITPLNASDTGQLYSEESIVWADEDPTKPMEALDELWEREPQDSWYESYSEAMRISRKEGKPVLLWFTNMRSNTASKALMDEVFSQAKFEEWANESVICLRIDSNVQDGDADRRERKRDYVRKLRKRYKVMGAPVVLMLSPRGTQFGKYRGYKKGDPLFYFGRLKSGYRNAMEDYGNWREEYESKGYRVWHDHKGRKVFAKPISLKDGVLMLKDPEGKRSKTSLKKLSAEDRAWVQDYVEKKKRR